jgi:hypothetical protein
LGRTLTAWAGQSKIGPQSDKAERFVNAKLSVCPVFSQL